MELSIFHLPLDIARGHIDKRFLTTLAGLDEDKKVSLLEDKDIWITVKKWEAAFANDPFYNYLREGKKPTFQEKLHTRMNMSFEFFVWRRTKIAITVDHGSSVVVAYAFQASLSSSEARLTVVKHSTFKGS
ncbi:hypothetical protein H1R20_g2930, partial [Candolleomyces eurysporus]